MHSDPKMTKKFLAQKEDHSPKFKKNQNCPEMGAEQGS